MSLSYGSPANAGILALKFINQGKGTVSSDLIGLLLAVYAFKAARRTNTGRKMVLDSEVDIEKFLGRSARALLNHPDAEYRELCQELVSASCMDLQALAEFGVEKEYWSSTSC